MYIHFIKCTISALVYNQPVWPLYCIMPCWARRCIFSCSWKYVCPRGACEVWSTMNRETRKYLEAMETAWQPPTERQKLIYTHCTCKMEIFQDLNVYTDDEIWKIVPKKKRHKNVKTSNSKWRKKTSVIVNVFVFFTWVMVLKKNFIQN